MVKVKDFKAGETAFLLDRTRTLNGTRQNIIKETTITKVGSRYVTCTYGRYHCKHEHINNFEFCLENETWNSHMLLFVNRDDIDKFLEKEKLVKWLDQVTNYHFMINRYSLEQLRQVKQILEPDN